MENDSTKNKHGRNVIGIAISFIIGAIVGIFVGMLIKGSEIMWLLIGIGCGVFMGIGISAIFRRGKTSK